MYCSLASTYSVQNMIQLVRFSEAISNLLFPTVSASKKCIGAPRSNTPISDIVEVDPSASLQRLIKETKETLKLKSNIRYHALISLYKKLTISILEVLQGSLL